MHWRAARFCVQNNMGQFFLKQNRNLLPLTNTNQDNHKINKINKVFSPLVTLRMLIVIFRAPIIVLSNSSQRRVSWTIHLQSRKHSHEVASPSEHQASRCYPASLALPCESQAPGLADKGNQVNLRVEITWGQARSIGWPPQWLHCKCNPRDGSTLPHVSRSLVGQGRQGRGF